MNTTAHPVAPEEVMAFLDGELSDADGQAVSAHLEHCAECNSLAEQFRSTSQALSRWQVQAVPAKLEHSVADLTTKVRAGLTTGKSNIFIRASFWTWKQWSAGLGATAGALLVLVAIAVPNLMRSKMAANEATATSQLQRQQPERAFSDGTSAGKPTVDISRYSAKLAVEADKVGGGGGGGDRLTSQPAETINTPMIARTVSLTLVVKDFSASRAMLDAILARHHAYAGELSASTAENAARSLQASLRVPAPELASVLSELKSLGRLEHETQNGEEVTQQHADLVARLKNSRETEQRMQAILIQRTGKISDVLEVEQEIARVRGEIEQMEAEQKNLEHRVEFATVNLNLSEDYKAQLNAPAASVSTRIHNAFVEGYRNLMESLLEIVLFFAEYGLTLVIWLAILGLPVMLVWRRYRRTLATV